VTGVCGNSAQVLSDAIGAIYDCALDPLKWPAACRTIASLCESTAGGICVHDLRHAQYHQLFLFGYQQQFLEELGRHYAESPMASSDAVANLGDVKVLSIESRDLYETRFFHDVLKKFGLRGVIWFPAQRTERCIASLHASRSETAPHYGEREISFLRLLSPHVCRAFAISDALDIRTVRSEMLERTLDGLVSGVYLTARDGRVVYMNATAERQVRKGRAIQLVNDRLFLTDPGARAILKKAIDQAGLDGIDMDMSAHSLAVPHPDGTGYVATCLPVASGQYRNAAAPFAASCAVFMQDPVQEPLMPGKAFAKLHCLTGGELRVLLALAGGLTGKEAADMLGISEPTIRTHLQRMFAKTGTSRQTKLLQLLHNSTPPIQPRHVPTHGF